MKKPLTRGERNIRFIETLCVVPEGDLVGQPVILDDFQKKFIKDIYDNPAGTDTAILSMGRKNAKTGLIAFIVLLHIVGPEAKQNSRIISGAMSREQASEVYNLASKCVMLSPRLQGVCKVIPSKKMILGIPMGTEYQAISADASTAHGKSPAVAILDEVGQIRGPQSDFIDAITTSQGGWNSPLLIYISTQAPTDADFFSVLIDDYKKNKPPKTVCHVYEAPEDADLMDEEAWKAANPALGRIRSIEDVRKQAQKAKRMPSFENTFRNLILNQRVSVVAPFVSRSVWELNGADPESLKGLEVFGGLDLSSRTDLTALVLRGKDKKGLIHTHTFAWTPKDGILDRSRRDRVPYDIWAKKGYLRTTPGKTVDYDFVAAEIAEITAGLDVQAIAFDRWRIEMFKQACARVGVTLPLVEHGQGFKDMSPALDALESDLLNGRICHGNHPVLTMCAGNSTVTKDPSGGRKLDKSKATGRIDCMVALAMAEGAANGEKKEKAPEYKVFFVG